MSHAERDPLHDLERRRIQLEESIAKLRQSLLVWQTWELEYETFKEEIERAGVEASAKRILEAGVAIEGELVNEKEIKELMQYNSVSKRNAQQTIHTIEKRLEYVTSNIVSLRKQVNSTENKLNAILVLEQPDLTDEQGLPLTEIREELDEDGNVISSSLSIPGQSAPKILDVLEKAGINDLDEALAKGLDQDSKPEHTGTDKTTSPQDPIPGQGLEGPKTTPPQVDKNSTSRKKSVSFAPDTKEATPQPGAAATSRGSGTTDKSDPKWDTFKGRVIELDDHDNAINSYVVPDNESPEDAALRKEMIEYGLNEVGAVVAEIDLEDGSDFDDDWAEYDEDYEDGDSEYEDETGRSLRRGVSESYRAEMQELEKKLESQMMKNLGPRPDINSLGEYADDVRRLVVQPSSDNNTKPPAATVEKTPGKKGVRFADGLDVSPAPEASESHDNAEDKVSGDNTPTIAAEIVERKAKPSAAQPSAPKPGKVSRFKSSRSADPVPVQTSSPLGYGQIPMPFHLRAVDKAPRPTPEGPPGKILSPDVVERSVSADEIEHPEESNLDPAFLKRQVEEEYYKMRNRIIQQQGGFKPSPQDEEEGPLMEEKDGKIQKVSRFKAAKLQANGA